MDGYKEFMDSFKGADADDITQFWRSLGSAITAYERAAVMKDTLVLTKSDIRMAKDLGSYMPLAWYDRQGFDTALIKLECKDTLARPMLGLCYNVPILQTGEINLDSRVRQQCTEGPDAPRAIAYQQQPRSVRQPAKAKAGARGKIKRRKVPIVESEADKKVREKKDADGRRKKMSEASRIQLKVSPLVIELGALLGSAATKKQAPVWAFTAASEQLKKAKVFDANTKSVIGSGADLKYTLVGAINVIKDCMVQKSLIVSMLGKAPAST